MTGKRRVGRIPRELRATVKAAAARGWRPPERTGGGHLKMTHSSGGSVVISGSSSDHRSIQNLLANMRKIERNP